MYSKGHRGENYISNGMIVVFVLLIIIIVIEAYLIFVPRANPQNQSESEILKAQTETLRPGTINPEG